MYEWMFERGKNVPVHLIDNRCKDLGEGGERSLLSWKQCMSKCKWVRAAIWLEVREQRREPGIKGHYSSFLHKETTSIFLLFPPGGWWDSRHHSSVGIDLDTRQMDSATRLQTDSSAGNSTSCLSPQWWLGVYSGTNWLTLAHQSPTSPSHRENCIEITGGYPLCSLTLKVDANGKNWLALIQ